MAVLQGLELGIPPIQAVQIWLTWCEITRGDNGKIIRRKFSVEDAKRAGLWDTRPKLKRNDSSNNWRE